MNLPKLPKRKTRGCRQYSLKGQYLRNLPYSFWAIFWRLAAVLFANYVVTSVGINILYKLSGSLDTTMMIGASANHLTTGLIFLLLALRQANSDTCEPGEPSFHWRNTYLILAVVTALLLILKLAALLLLPRDILLSTLVYLPRITFLIVWPILAIRLSRFRATTSGPMVATA